MSFDKELNTHLSRRQRQIYSLLKDLVEIQSGSRNKAGVDRVVHRIKAEMEPLGFVCEILEQEALGNHLLLRSPGFKPGEPHLLITGHMDTVFPQDTEFRTYSEDEDHCYGPGTADMKGGLVVGMAALEALTALEAMPGLPVSFFFNSDEEIGSPSSREAIAREAATARAAFVLEAGGLNNEIVVGRKGNLSVQISVEGEAGHAAFAGPDKASAIMELAHKTLALEALNSPEKGISANVGVFKGGMGRNVVAAHAVADVDFRFPDVRGEKTVREGLGQIMATTRVAGTHSRMKEMSGRPPMPATPGNIELYDRAEQVGARLGIPVRQQIRQGVSDANTIAETGTPVLDGLGPCGAKDHSHDEYIIKQSLMDRTLLFAGILSGF